MKKFALTDTAGLLIAQVYANDVEEIITHLKECDPSVQMDWRDEQKISMSDGFVVKETICCSFIDEHGNDQDKRREMRQKLASVLEDYGASLTMAQNIVNHMEADITYNALWRDVEVRVWFRIYEVTDASGIFYSFEDCKKYITPKRILHK